jgi:MtN3 and saliva related transmembrane protein
MNIDVITLMGFSAGAITSAGFIPQLIRGYRTKKLDDISYGMPAVLALGMSLWFFYGLLRLDAAVIIANAVGIFCNVLLVLMKKHYLSLRIRSRV